MVDIFNFVFTYFITKYFCKKKILINCKIKRVVNFAFTQCVFVTHKFQMFLTVENSVPLRQVFSIKLLLILVLVYKAFLIAICSFVIPLYPVHHSINKCNPVVSWPLTPICYEVLNKIITEILSL